MLSRVQSILDLAADFTTIGGLVVIGGYAVSARSRPRFSQDFDIVVRNDSLPRIEAVLRGKGLIPGKPFTNPDKNVEVGDTTREWARADPPATIDVMAGGRGGRGGGGWGSLGEESPRGPPGGGATRQG